MIKVVEGFIKRNDLYNTNKTVIVVENFKEINNKIK